jgi:transaldolase
MELYYDGMNIQKYGKDITITGFTTNCTLFSISPVKKYAEFYEKNKDYINNKSISFQIWEEDHVKAIQQIKDIYSINPSIFIKIPIINTKGEYNTELVQFAVKHNMSINITAIYTIEQINITYELLKNSLSPQIISVFAGPISDTGIDPSPFILHAINLFKDKTNSKILWAGCREIYTVTRARQLGCHIITIPDGVIEKLQIANASLTQLSIDRVKKFNSDATTSSLIIL